MNWLRLSALLLILYAPLSWSQCAPGIPGAGNPGCIPPATPGSPYGQPTTSGVTGSAPPATWEDQWGAVAMDYANGASGSVSNSPTKERATRSAIVDCKGQGGTSCEIMLTFRNQCAAIVQRSDGGFFYGATAAEKQDAESRAIVKCGHGTVCNVLYSQCNYPVRTQ
jgi:hypothetical protein